MKASSILLLSAITLANTPALAHPSHDTAGARKAAPGTSTSTADKPYGRPGEAGQVTRTVNLDIGVSMRVTPANISVKQGETIKFIFKNSTKSQQVVLVGTAADLKDRAAMLKQFPKMEMNQPNQTKANAGESAELVWQFTKAGTFNIGCAAPACLDNGAAGKIAVNAK